MKVSYSSVALALLGACVSVYALSDHPFLGGAPGIGRSQQVLAGFGLALAAAGLLPRRVKGRLLLGFVVIVACLGAVELALRLVAWHRFVTPTSFDPDTIYRLHPGSRGELVMLPENGGHHVVYVVNRDGYRGPELLPNRPALRIAVYGDSFVHAGYVEDEVSFVRRIERHAEAAIGQDVEVVNAGVQAYGPDQVACKVAKELPSLRPDVVVVAVFTGNDFGDLERNKMFALAADGALRPRPWRLAPDLQLQFDLRGRESVLKKLVLRAFASDQDAGAVQSVAPQVGPTALVEHWLTVAESEHADYLLPDPPIVSNLNLDIYNADVALRPGSPSAFLRKALMAGVMARIRTDCLAADTPLVFVAIPHPMDCCPEYEASKVDRQKFPDYRPECLCETVVGIARSLEVPCVDLFPLFSAAGCAGLFYRGGDDHWNEKRQDAAAQTVCGLLQQRGLLVRRSR